MKVTSQLITNSMIFKKLFRENIQFVAQSTYMYGIISKISDTPNAHINIYANVVVLSFFKIFRFLDFPECYKKINSQWYFFSLCSYEIYL